MEQDGTWGDHVILYATANRYKTYIDVISFESNYRDVTVRPDGHVISTNPLVLGHVHEVHYVSLQPKQGTVRFMQQFLSGSLLKDVSSANNLVEKNVEVFGRSLIKIINSKGPRIDP